MKNILVFLFIGILFLSCHSRYWYRSKVKAGSLASVSAHAMQESDTQIEVSMNDSYTPVTSFTLSLNEPDSPIKDTKENDSITVSTYPKEYHPKPIAPTTPDPEPKKKTSKSLIIGFVIILVAGVLLAITGLANGGSAVKGEGIGCGLLLLAGLAFIGFFILFIGLLFS